MKIFTKEFWFENTNSMVPKLKVSSVFKLIVFIIVLIIVIFNFPFGTVGAGERGIKLRFNAVTSTVLKEGLYFRIPFVERVVIMDVKTQKEEVQASSASKDLQTVTAKIALNYSINPESVGKIYQTIGIDYKIRIIDPFIQESVKASTAKFTAEELVTKRDEVKEDIKNHLVSKFEGTGILVEQFSIIDFDFSPSFNQAIEAKVTAEQNALASKNKLEQVKYEAQQAIEEATGKAKALQIEGDALSKNPAVKELRAIEKWNGVLPTVTGGSIPLINIK